MGLPEVKSRIEKHRNQLLEAGELEMVMDSLRFEEALNHGQLFFTEAKHRRIGKSSLILKKAAEEGVPVIVETRSIRDFFRSTCRDLELTVEIYALTEPLRGNNSRKGVYIDEVRSPYLVQNLLPTGARILGGSVYLSS